jgi:hypothetical protein
MITMFITASNKNFRSHGISVSCNVKFQLYRKPLFHIFKILLQLHRNFADVDQYYIQLTTYTSMDRPMPNLIEIRSIISYLKLR